jgi:hypothetical protein
MPRKSEGDDDERAPLLGSWSRWYALVLMTLAALVAGFAALAHHYR